MANAATTETVFVNGGACTLRPNHLAPLWQALMKADREGAEAFAFEIQERDKRDARAKAYHAALSAAHDAAERALLKTMILKHGVRLGEDKVIVLGDDAAAVYAAVAARMAQRALEDDRLTPKGGAIDAWAPTPKHVWTLSWDGYFCLKATLNGTVASIACHV